MSQETPVKIIGHKTEIKRIGKSSKYVAGLWQLSCECGFVKVSKGQAIIAMAKKRHENEVVFQ